MRISKALLMFVWIPHPSYTYVRVTGEGVGGGRDAFICPNFVFCSLAVLLFRSTKPLALRPTTAPTVLTNMGPLCVSAERLCNQCYADSH